jgi:hypothetical protein
VTGSSTPFPIGGPASAPWREQSLARAAEYRFIAQRLRAQAKRAENQAKSAENQAKSAENRVFSQEDFEAIDSHIKAAERAAENPRLTLRGAWSYLKSFLQGAAVERASTQLDAVKSELLRVAPDEYLSGQLTGLVAHVRLHLEPDDLRRQRVEEIAQRVEKRQRERQDDATRREPIPGQRPRTGRQEQDGKTDADPDLLTEIEREQIIGAVRAANLDARREILRVRSFRNVLFVTALILALGVGGLIVFGALQPGRIALCFVPDNKVVVCPTASEAVPKKDQTAHQQTTPSAEQEVKIDRRVRTTSSTWDIPVVAIVGLLAAGLAGAFSLRQIQGTSTPYSLPVAAAVLKLPTGALTAVLGLLLMRGGFVPGLSALDTSAQIIAWAIVFGYSQQLLTRFVDQQANTVLRNVDNPTPELEVPSEAPSRVSRGQLSWRSAG